MLQHVKSISAPRAILLCPGPVMLSKAVRDAVANTCIGHREPEFSQLLAESCAMIKPIVGIDPDDPSYQVTMVTSSGTGANETVLSAISQLGRVLVISNGEFGERLLEMCRLHGEHIDHLHFDWRQPFDLGSVEHRLSHQQYQAVVMVHHDTSTGILNPVAQVAALAHRYGAIIAVDMVSSIGAELIQAKDWGVDVLTGTSGKALSAMPGTGIVVMKTDLIDRLKTITSRSHYLDLQRLFAYMQDLLQTPNTPAVHVFVSLHASLCQIHSQGPDAFRSVIHHRALYTRRRLKKLSLVFADYGLDTASAITCVNLPSYLSFNELAKYLKQRGIVVYNGKGPLKDKIFQIGHIGALHHSDTVFALDQLEALLRKSQTSHRLGSDMRGQGVFHAYQ